MAEQTYGCTIDDLETGMVCLLRNGRTMSVYKDDIKNRAILLDPISYLEIGEDLRPIQLVYRCNNDSYCGSELSEFVITKVFDKPSAYIVWCLNEVVKIEKENLLWERGKRYTSTVKQRRKNLRKRKMLKEEIYKIKDSSEQRCEVLLFECKTQTELIKFFEKTKELGFEKIRKYCCFGVREEEPLSVEKSSEFLVDGGIAFKVGELYIDYNTVDDFEERNKSKTYKKYGIVSVDEFFKLCNKVDKTFEEEKEKNT